MMRFESLVNINKKKAISLIILIITIVIMIIFAGTIITVLNNTGIISRSKLAVNLTNTRQIQELAITAWGEAIMENEYKNEEELKEIINQKLIDRGIKEESLGKYWIKVDENGVKVYDTTGSVTSFVDGVPIPKGFAASPYGADIARGKAENTKAGGLVIYELHENETKIPTAESYYTSLTKRNQYVWIPVDSSKFSRIDWYNENDDPEDDYMLVDENGDYYSIGTQDKFWEVTPYTILDEETSKYVTEQTLEEVQKMYASVKKYGGFYIARYEAGLENIRGSATTSIVKTLANVHSKMNKIPYNYMSFSNVEAMSEENGAAVEVARSLYRENDPNYGVVSTLPYGVQWDRILSWWLETGAKDIYGNEINVFESTTYGNYNNHEIAYDTFNTGAKYTTMYKDANPTYLPVTTDKPKFTNWLLTTGATEATRINNIYDLAGNLFESTMEGYSTEYRVSRGSRLYNNGDDEAVSRRSRYSPALMNYYTGFRPALYIK